MKGQELLVPFVRAAGADLNFTLGLALISFVSFIAWGIRVNGVRGYLLELVGEPAYMAPLLTPIHTISELSGSSACRCDSSATSSPARS